METSLQDLCFLEEYSKEIDGFIYSHLEWQKNDNSEITFYFSSYCEVCERIYNSILDGNDSDAIILPLLFLIRHTVEIGIKELTFKLKYLRTTDYEKSYDNVFGTKGKGHNLQKLYDSLVCEIKCFDEFKESNIEKELENITIGIKKDNTSNTNIDNIENYMYESFKDDKNNLFEFLKEFVNMLHNIDTSSFTFRYSTDKKDNKSLNTIKSVNISLIFGLFLQLVPVLDVKNFEETFLITN